MSALRLPRSEHRRRPGRPRLRTLSGSFWTVIGGLVLLFAFFAAMGAFDPAEAVGVTLVFAALALLWLLHAWPRLRGR